VGQIFFAVGKGARTWEEGWHFEVARAQRASDARTPLRSGGLVAQHPRSLFKEPEDVVPLPENARRLGC